MEFCVLSVIPLIRGSPRAWFRLRWPGIQALIFAPAIGRVERNSSRRITGEKLLSESPLKSMAAHRGLKAGTFIFEFDVPGIGYVLKHAGCDYVVLDTEHSGFGIETVKRVMTYARAAELPTIVRSPSRDYKDIARILDAGAEGVMLPMVSNADEAKSIIRSMKYVPNGARGVVVRSAVDCYTAGPTMEKLAAQNRRTLLVAQIENVEGVENAEAIGALEEVDCLWVGHFDLTCSLGIPGDFEHPRFVEAIEAVIEAGRATDTSLGRLVPDVDTGVALYAQGFDFIAYSADSWVLGDAMAAGLSAIRSACAS